MYPSRASIAGHPIHPMLVVFPIGLWVFSFIADLLYVSGGNPVWKEVAYYTLAGGIVGALAAAIPGAIDLFSLPEGRARRIGIVHMAINLGVVILYAINFGMRSIAEVDAVGPIWLSAFTIALLGISGWLGGEMVYVHGVGVGSRASADRPSPRVAASRH